MSNAIRALTLVGCLLGQRCDAATIEQIRAALAADAHGPQGEQLIHFGPLRDGREFNVTSKIVNDSLAVNIRRTGTNAFLINIGRSLTINALFAFDASMVCARFPPTACDRMPEYLRRVLHSPDPAKAPILEEVFPDLRRDAQISRSDEVLYNASLLAGIDSLMLMVTLHELGHAALGHLDAPVDDNAAIVAQEGEADGFASYVAKLSGRPPVGLAFAFLFDGVRETVTGSMPVMHPKAACRAALMAERSVEWLKDNEATLLKPSDDKAYDALGSKLLDQALSTSSPGSVEADNLAGCTGYAKSFASGFRKAQDLVDKETRLESVVPGQQ